MKDNSLSNIYKLTSSISLIFFLFFLPSSVNAQLTEITETPVTLYETYTGHYNYTATGGTLRTVGDTVDGNGTNIPGCAVTNTDSQNLTGIPVGATITKAYLYWSGSGQTVDSDITFQGQAIIADRTYISNFSFYNGNTTFNLYHFNAIADVTNLVQTNGNTTYTFADLSVDTSNDYCVTGGVLSGWALVVIYSEVNLPLKKVNLYEGFELNRNTTSTFGLSGLNVPVNPTGNATGIFWEGDETLQGTTSIPEQLRFNGNALTDAYNPAVGAFNSTVNTLSDPLEIPIQYGVDIDSYDVTAYVSQGDVSATVAVQTANDLVISNVILIAVDTYVPELVVSKTSNTAGVPVVPGQTITFTIEIENIAQFETARDLIVTDYLPAGISYVPNSAEKTYTIVGGTTTANYDNATSASFDNNCPTEITRTINVPNSFIIDDLNVGFNMDHSYKGDMNVYVTSPAGTKVQLIQSTSDDSNNWDVLLDSESGNSYASLFSSHVTSTPLYDVVGQPLNSLAIFNGENAQGDWIVSFCDDESSDTANYNSSRLAFTYSTLGSTITDPAGAPPNLITAAEGIDIAPGQSVTITFDALVDNPIDFSITQIENEAVVNASNLPEVVASTVVDVVVDACDATASGNTDTDSDDVSDICDLDDDNDGILDTNEMECGGSTTFDFSALQTTSNQTIAQLEGIINNSTQTINGSKMTIDITENGTGQVDYLQITNNHHTDKYGIRGRDYDNPTYNDGIDYKYTFDKALKDFSFTILDIDDGDAVEIVGYYLGNEVPISYYLYPTTIITYIGNNQFTSPPNTESALNENKGTIDIDFNGYMIDEFIVRHWDSDPHGTFTMTAFSAPCSDMDTDNDGIPDRLDTDSDNDGCPDAIEGAGNFTADDLTSSNNLADANEGTVDTDGIPTNTGSPQATTTAVTTSDVVTSISITPDPAKVCEGSNISLTATPTGVRVTDFSTDPDTTIAIPSGDYMYAWYLGTSTTPLTDTAPYSGTSTASLTIANATTTLSGNEYRVEVTTINNSCPQEEDITLTVQAQPNAGTDGLLSICEGEIVTATQLFAQLGGGPDTGGTWTPALAGADIYTYTVAAIAPCTTDSTAIVTVTEQALPYAGENGTLLVCDGSTPSNTDLFNALEGSPQTGGTWSGPVSGVYTYTVDPTSPCTGASDTATVSIEDEADLSLTKGVENVLGTTITTANVNEVVYYRVTLTNDGPCDATGVTVQDRLPTGVSYISGSSTITEGTFTVDGSNIGTWDLSSLTIASGTSKEIVIAVNVGAGCSDITNFVQVMSSDQPDPDSTPANNN